MAGTKFPPDAILRIGAQLADLLDAMAAATPTTEPAEIGVVWRNAGVLTVSVGIPPVITLQPVSQTIDSGDSVTFTVTATNATSYQWRRGGVDVVGATSSSYTFATVNGDTGAGFDVVVTGPGGTATSNVATLTVTQFVHYYISTTGSDSNDGLSAVNAWQSLLKINNSIIVTGQKTRVNISAGTYSKATDYISCTPAVSNSLLKIVCETGTVWDGTAVNVAAGIAATFLSGTAEYEIRGNGLTIQNYKRVGDTPNGIGTHGTAVVRVYDVNTTLCGDGFSSHESSQMFLYDCTSLLDDRAYIVVGTTYNECHRCEFDITVNACGTGTDTATGKLYDCTLTPRAAGALWFPRGLEHYDCIVGSLAAKMGFQISSILGLFHDCYVHADFDGSCAITMLRCYGRIGTRVRSGGAVNLQHCVFVGSVTGGSINAIPRGTSALGSSQIICNNNIFYGSYTMQNIDASNAALLVSDASQFWNNCLFGGVAYDPDLIAADTGGTVVTNTVTSSPMLLGPANTLVQSDYAVDAASPCVGAGTAGSNIGFTLADIA